MNKITGYETHQDWLKKMRPHITIFYKGINITEKVGLCVCKNCIGGLMQKMDEEICLNKLKKPIM